METLLKSKNLIFDIKSKIENLDTSLFSHYVINNYEINANTTSVVMTASNRSKQTYFTLTSMLKSKIKNLQIIIVDDSTNDPININVLKNYPYYIDLIQVNRQNKIWFNPLVNYNLGFKFIKGSYVIIQNAEVCHLGDVLSNVHNKALDDYYCVFDVKPSKSYETNEEIYINDISTVDIYDKEFLFGDIWYQSVNHNRNFHFLTAMNINTFDKVKCFSYDMTMGSCYDDDDFLLKIISKKILVLNLFNTEYKCGGIHMFHGYASHNWDYAAEFNETFFKHKKRIYNDEGIYIDVTENGIDCFDNIYNRLLE